MENVPAGGGLQDIIGESPALKRALELVSKLASSDAPVLILGEAGSGKELIARAVHRIGARRNKSLVHVNCAATPAEMLSDELFGHETGASGDPDINNISGPESANTEEVNSDETAPFPLDYPPPPPREATRPEFEQLGRSLFRHKKRAEGNILKIGRLEQANMGTIFLDEIAPIPLNIQAKLIRLLEKRQFERLGSWKSIPVNVRLIASTKCDLGERVAERMFRGDLYNELNVSPIRMPPLRERPEDIPLLALFFLQKFARRMNKNIESIPADTMNFLVEWKWPGNVRQLQNLIERSVVLTDGPELQVPLEDFERESET